MTCRLTSTRAAATALWMSVACAPMAPHSRCESAADCPAAYTCDRNLALCVPCRQVGAPGLSIAAIAVEPGRVDPGQAGVEMRLGLANGGACDLRVLTTSAIFTREGVDVSADFRVRLPLPGITVPGAGSADLVVGLDASATAEPGEVRLDAIVTAAYPDGSTLSGLGTAAFVVTGLPTDAATLRFRVQPGGVYAGVPLNPQPQVEALDHQGELVVGAHAVRLEVALGDVALGGTSEAELSDGLAVFTDLFVSGTSEHIVLRARLGDLSVDSAAFAIAEAVPPAGACLSEGQGFVTAEGGCKDEISGLVWSRMAAETKIWDEWVWDSRRASARQPDAFDLGRTNDYAEPSNASDSSIDDWSSAYCHDLVEGGRLDWRCASAAEVMALLGHEAQAGQRVARTGSMIWTSTLHPQIGAATAINLANGVAGPYSGWDTYPALCVRGGRKPAVGLEILESPALLGLDQTPSPPLRLAVVDADGRQVNAQVDLVLSGSAALGGTLRYQADRVGVATLDTWFVGEAGEHDLVISAEGLSSTTLQVRVGPFPHTCLVEDEGWQSADGGCKQVSTGLVWSRPSLTPMIWSDAIWDSENPSGNTPPDEHDHGRTNDYAGGASSEIDASRINFCHELEEGGQLDWRVPTEEEFGLAFENGQGAPVHWLYETNQDLFSSNTREPYVVACNLATNRCNDGHSVINRRHAVCVRDTR